jgi:hypothetical protein
MHPAPRGTQTPLEVCQELPNCARGIRNLQKDEGPFHERMGPSVFTAALGWPYHGSWVTFPGLDFGRYIPERTMGSVGVADPPAFSTVTPNP